MDKQRPTSRNFRPSSTYSTPAPANTSKSLRRSASSSALSSSSKQKQFSSSNVAGASSQVWFPDSRPGTSDSQKKNHHYDSSGMKGILSRRSQLSDSKSNIHYTSQIAKAAESTMLSPEFKVHESNDVNITAQDGKEGELNNSMQSLSLYEHSLANDKTPYTSKNSNFYQPSNQSTIQRSNSTNFYSSNSNFRNNSTGVATILGFGNQFSSNRSPLMRYASVDNLRTSPNSSRLGPPLRVPTSNRSDSPSPKPQLTPFEPIPMTRDSDKEKKMKWKTELDLQVANERILKLEKQLKEQKEAKESIEKKFKKQEDEFESILKKEQSKFEKLRREIETLRHSEKSALQIIETDRLNNRALQLQLEEYDKKVKTLQSRLIEMEQMKRTASNHSGIPIPIRKTAQK
ncbi:hypothetical protein HK098_005897 [Nowakowskiella sp. JEL0407]|nr:hypothetical protein HK098_005897 [Nowakowskiella sp. JEL0407]